MQRLEENFNIVDNSKKELPENLLSTLFSEEKSDTEFDKQNKKILMDHFLNNKSWAEIGRELSLTRERVRQRGSEAIEKIREKYRLILEDAEFFTIEKGTR